ncbi:hypothetical protein BHE74_00056540, partial [Ensete ventricosum]
RRRGEPGFLPALRDPSPVGDFFSPWGEKKRLPTWGERMRRRRRARAGRKNVSPRGENERGDCASAMDNLATFYFNHITFGEVPASPASMNFTRHIAECPNLFTEVH